MSNQAWIPVSKRLPNESGYYLYSATSRNVDISFYSNGKWDCEDKGYKVTAWQTRPLYYKEV